MTLSAGTRLSSYEIVRAIGAGGMGEVYRARDTKLSRDVAIKVLPPGLAKDVERLARFEKEARTASALNHPNIVTIYEIGEADGESFIAMELVEGKTLRELIGAGPLPLKRLLSVAAQTADGLAKAHAAGIVHRDLKPENMMVTRDGFVKILDFGLAKLVPIGFQGSRGTSLATVTRGTEAGTVLGTVGYMSPEQASGEPADFRSDQFSLGSILYEMASGKRAFERPTDAQTLSAIIESEPEPLSVAAPRTPMNLVWVIERCLSKDPEDRYGSTKDLARDLGAMRQQSSAVSVSGATAPAVRRMRLSGLALASAVLVAIGLTVLAFVAGQRIQARRDREAPAPKRTTLTFRRGTLTGARFAPDGQAIVYSAAWDGRPSEIFTTRVGSTESRALGISDAGILAVSSTGEMAIALGCFNHGSPCVGDLARAPLAGGAPKAILDGVYSADWSPDGKDLAVIRTGSLQYPIGKELYAVPGKGYLSSIRVSPRGDLVAFLEYPSWDSERGRVCVVDRAGKKRILTEEWARLRPILWSPTGEEVFFSRWGGREIRGVGLSGRTRTVSIPGLDDASRDGLFLDAGMLHENFRGAIRGLVPDEVQERDLSWLMGSIAVELSSDGHRLLLYEEGRNPDQPGGQEIFRTYLRPTDGSDATLLGEGRALALSPDEKWALVVRPSEEPQLALLPTGAGEPRLLPLGDTRAEIHRRATFFPDGKRILFSVEARGRKAHLYVQDVEGGGLPKKFSEDELWAPVVSPDGRRVAAQSGGQCVIYPADGGGPPQRIGAADAGGIPIQWSADGKTLYIQVPEDQPLTLHRLDISTGRRERWKQLSPPDLTGFVRYGPRMHGVGATVTRDGKYYAYTYFTDSNRLVLAEVGPDWWK